MPGSRDIIILGEVAEGGLAPITGELAAAGAGLAQELGGELVGLLAGDGVDALGQEVIALGATTVHLIQHPLLADPRAEPLLAAVTPLFQELQPAVVLLGKTPLGQEVGPRLAVRLGAGLAQDCVSVGLDGDTGVLTAVRPVYGGNAMARVAVRTAPALATLRPKAFDPPAPDPSRRGEVVLHQPDLDPQSLPTRLLERVRAEAPGVRLEDARVVVGGGRGLGGPEPFALLEELAGLLGGAVGASRAACDAGWVPHSYQVGLTGKSIGAELYITVGISGASQHLAGISGVKNLVAVDRDEGANIFREARYGVVGSWEKVLPSFLEAVRELVRS